MRPGGTLRSTRLTSASAGQAYYAVDAAHDLATLDIKLRPEEQGRGIASRAMSQVLEEILGGGLASRAYAIAPDRVYAPSSYTASTMLSM